jgi:hypothetical protein
MKPIAHFAIACIALAGCSRHEKVAIAPEAPVWMDTEIEKQAKTQAPNAQQIGAIMKDGIEELGGMTEFNVQLEDHKCYWFSAVGDEGMSRLGLFVFEGKSKIAAASQKSKDARAVATLCVKTPGMHRVRIKVGDGAGHVGVGIYGEKALEAPPPAEAKKQTWEEIEAQVSEEAGSAAQGAKQVGKFMRAEDRQQWSVQMQAGKCYWAVAVGGDGVKELALYLWDPNNKRVADNKMDNKKVSVGHCPTESAMYRFETKLVSGSGKYAVGIYEKAK